MKPCGACCFGPGNIMWLRGLILAVASACLATPSVAQTLSPPATDNLEQHDPDIDIYALMSGKCTTLKIAGRDFACKAVGFFHSEKGRVNFAIALDDPADNSHIVSFSGENGQRTQNYLYELPVDRITTRRVALGFAGKIGGPARRAGAVGLPDGSVLFRVWAPAAKRVGLVDVVIPTLETPWAFEVLRGAEKEANRLGASLILTVTHDQHDRPREWIKTLPSGWYAKRGTPPSRR